jgi:hypothetical protein
VPHYVVKLGRGDLYEERVFERREAMDGVRWQVDSITRTKLQVFKFGRGRTESHLNPPRHQAQGLFLHFMVLK